MANTPANILLLGIGNLLWADEGFGVRVIEHLQKHYRFPDNVQVVDGGTQGVYLIEHVQAADVLVVFDAVDYGLPPATMKRVENDEVPNFLGAKKMSLHQTGFQEVLALAQMLGEYPQHLLLIGVQPEELEDYGGSLRPAVKAQIQPAIEMALSYLQRFGVVAECVDTPQALADPILNIQRYEQERPSPEQACRLGDERIVLSAAFEVKLPPASDLPSLQVDVDYRGKY
ncbi:HyaD/HybD family hydrogenase maturation endopeptidase [Methylomonas sp. EFPC1]|uniref:HyaD/HybD family hydrogenase maturation endopeptidase n=1 Tax=unclassified Methylomonas TaxID=2608980 RepID=UPI00051BB217|nr:MULTISPECIES: HyaD/HybD family hydrogenase maturation endopeptidase [unclassified Methylomonas]QBC29170.1 HyaD/HybD family hydrogenase maturation endopeptidase [Methylomonas sp. LW13]QSB00753.1 HyaD/HybD family hydrogenase maturation endopeptidase [Methylomonas sp. EFPC1]